jgi:hypothetical protein
MAIERWIGRVDVGPARRRRIGICRYHRIAGHAQRRVPGVGQERWQVTGRGPIRIVAAGNSIGFNNGPARNGGAPRTTDFPGRQRVSADSAPAAAYC